MSPTPFVLKILCSFTYTLTIFFCEQIFLSTSNLPPFYTFRNFLFLWDDKENRLCVTKKSRVEVEIRLSSESEGPDSLHGGVDREGVLLCVYITLKDKEIRL